MPNFTHIHSCFCFHVYQVLKLLNSNSENPYLIWNNGTRAELLEFLEAQQEANIRRVSRGERMHWLYHMFQHGRVLSL